MHSSHFARCMPDATPGGRHAGRGRSWLAGWKLLQRIAGQAVRRRQRIDGGWCRRTAATLVAEVSAAGWQLVRAGRGGSGPWQSMVNSARHRAPCRRSVESVRRSQKQSGWPSATACGSQHARQTSDTTATDRPEPNLRCQSWIVSRQVIERERDESVHRRFFMCNHCYRAGARRGSDSVPDGHGLTFAHRLV